jgi:hypothetical protein
VPGVVTNSSASGAGQPRRPVTSNLTDANSEIVRRWWDSACQARKAKHYSMARTVTGVLLDYLERLNMRYPKGRELDDVTRNAIHQVLAELPQAWRPSLTHSRTVQEALDQVFDLKCEIRRRALPNALPASWNWYGDAQHEVDK